MFVNIIDLHVNMILCKRLTLIIKKIGKQIFEYKILYELTDVQAELLIVKN